MLTLVQTGTVSIDDEEYSLNDDFKLASQQLADELDLDELEAAKLFLEAQDEAQELERSPLAIAVFRFHRHRQLLLDCLRIIVRESSKINDGEDNVQLVELRIGLAEVVRKILGFQERDVDAPSNYWRRCLESMTNIEQWQQRLSDQVQRYSVIGQPMSSELSEVIDFQQQSLLFQHESLAAIAAHLVQTNYTVVDDVNFLISKVRRIDRYDRTLVHWSAVLIAAIAHYGQAEENCSLEDARPINDLIVGGKETEHWAMRNFHGATAAWWLVQFSGRFNDPAGDDERERDRTIQFNTALDDGALHFTLAFAQDVVRNAWEDPAKTGLVTFLLSESNIQTRDFTAPSPDIQELICTGLQSFVEAFITNMPDTIRALSSAESESRKTMRSRFQRGNQDAELHVERFLALASYAYDKDAAAAMSFWAETDSNLYGFLQWAARRQTTPRAAAFCELIRSLSDDQTCADAVHRFLLDEGQPLGGRLRRTGSLSWSQILAELQFYATSLREKQSGAGTSTGTGAIQPVADEYVEPESAMMLESYLRLVSHLCERSPSAREWLLGNPDFQFHDLLFQLCTNALESRLRACAFTTISSLCTGKTAETGAKIWSALDAWIYGALPSTAALSKNLVRHDASGRHEDTILKSISSSLEESMAFLTLLESLVAPFGADSGLNDDLPYPEALGSTYRMPGIESYIDFALGRIFAEQSRRVERIADLHLLRLKCLRLAALCLSSFNEDLVVIANRAGTGVDGIIQASSLPAYVRLHPFARVMEWMYSEKAILALFASAHQNIEETNNSQADSPLVLSVLDSIKVITMVLKLQPTYLDIVRPLVKAQSNSSRTPVGNAALATFDDAILNNLQLVVDLGLYCGTGHQELTVASLGLLQLISVSPRLTASMSNGMGYMTERSKVLTILDCEDNADRISRGLAVEIRLSERELEAGPESPGHIIKKQILEFLLSSLLANRDVPTIAHSLLGFKCTRTTCTVAEGSLFSQSESLFHAIAKLAVQCPDYVDGALIYWTSVLKALCIRILQVLWQSSPTSRVVLGELQDMDFVFAAASQQFIIGLDTLWDGRITSDPSFIISDSAITYANFLQQRLAYFDLLARTLRGLPPSAITPLRKRLEWAMLGVTQFPGVDPVPTPSVFDLFDFMELDLQPELSPPQQTLLGEIDVKLCRANGNAQAPANLAGVEELLLLRQADLRKKGQLSTPETQETADFEAQNLILYTHGANQYHDVTSLHDSTLKAWAQLLAVALECCSFEETSKTGFSLQGLRLILPKLEKSFTDNIDTAKELTALALTLIQHIDLSDQPGDHGPPGDFAKDRLYHLFRLCMTGVGSFEIDPALRNTGYQICYRYLRKAAAHPTKKLALSQNILHTVKNLGDHLTDVICDDSVSGEAECRVSALLLLGALMEEANRSGSKYFLQSFEKVNFVGVLVDLIKTIPPALNQSSASDLPLLVAYYEALLSLLRHIAHTPAGAASVFNAGLFQSVRDSMLFTIDPDIGIDMESRKALQQFFNLMLAVLQVVNAVVLTRGKQNEQTIRQVRNFLRDTRPSMVGVFKRNARLTAGNATNGEDLADLVDNWTLLVSLAGFLEVCSLSQPQLDTWKC